jgi:hypothetical protein
MVDHLDMMKAAEKAAEKGIMLVAVTVVTMVVALDVMMVGQMVV